MLQRVKKFLCDLYLSMKEPRWRKRQAARVIDNKIRLSRGIKMVVFDLDGTLTRCPNSWRLVTEKYAGMQRVSEKIFRDYADGRMDARQLYENTINLWSPRPHRDFFTGICKNLEFNRGAADLVGYLKKTGIETAVISTGIGVFAEYASSRLGIRHFFANTLVFDADGILSGVQVNVTLDTKKSILEDLSKKIGIAQNEVMFVGDNAYDLEPVRWAGAGVFFDNANLHKTKADIIISSLEDLLGIFKKSHPPTCNGAEPELFSLTQNK